MSATTESNTPRKDDVTIPDLPHVPFTAFGRLQKRQPERPIMTVGQVQACQLDERDTIRVPPSRLVLSETTRSWSAGNWWISDSAWWDIYNVWSEENFDSIERDLRYFEGVARLVQRRLNTEIPQWVVLNLINRYEYDGGVFASIFVALFRHALVDIQIPVALQGSDNEDL